MLYFVTGQIRQSYSAVCGLCTYNWQVPVVEIVYVLINYYLWSFSLWNLAKYLRSINGIWYFPRWGFQYKHISFYTLVIICEFSLQDAGNG
jgi:hypothetical protein